jgi:alanine racemase
MNNIAVDAFDRPFSAAAAWSGMLLTVDLAAIAANWRQMSERMGDGQAAGVVKANAYGLGSETVGRVLAAAGCQTFFVATPEEGVTLRRALPQAEIYVLSGPIGDSAAGLEPFISHALRPVLNSGGQVALWQGHAPAEAEYAVQVETGMNRVGLPENEARALAGRLSPTILMSHLACADTPNEGQNAEQARRFAALRALYPQARGSLANSSGVFLGKDWQFDLARPGIALYGGNPTPYQANPMQPVVTLQLKIVQVRRVDTPQAVGYGATHRTEGETVLATVAAGYADGLLRSLSGSGWGLLGGSRVPVAGRVSMDLITFDVTAAPAEAVREGAVITLIGNDGDQIHTVDDLADEAGTISYELLTSLSRRAARRYVGGA